jgi:pimeloyl-ACP methyl ester carboxylesterase
MRRTLAIATREARAVARQGQLIFLRPRRRASAEPPGRRVVAFVHGWGAAGAVFEPLRERVERELSLPTVDFTYRSSWSFERVTAALAERLDPLARDGREIDLVGHSLGGLLSRWWVQEMDGAAGVRRVVTLATPHAGTRSARIAPGPLREALLPGSPVVQRLAAGRARAARIAHTAFVAGADLMVTPPASAAALPGAEVRWFDGVGHNAILFERAVHDAVVDALARPRAPVEPAADALPASEDAAEAEALDPSSGR